MIRPTTLALAIGLPLAMASLAMAQSGEFVAPVTRISGVEGPDWVLDQIQSPDDPRLAEYRKRQARRVDLERALFKLRGTYFRGVRSTEVRQAGIHRLRDYSDPAIFPSLLEIFKREGDDVRGAILDHLAELGTDESDATLAWAAVFGEDPWFRDGARERLARRAKEVGGTTARVRSVVAEGLRQPDDRVLASAANVAYSLKLYDAIPMLINAQVGGATATQVGRAGSGSLGWILIGTQQAFVSDLEPVVGDFAVGFDPELSVVTEGTYMRVLDAVVITYRVEVHNALVALTSEASGQSTARLGWDNRAWHDWYDREFRPTLARKEPDGG